MTSTRYQRINHPTDFSPESEIAYHHALRLAFAAHAGLDILHVDRARAKEWKEFPCAGETLERWRLLPPGSYGSDLAGVHVEKVAAHGREPLRPILDYLDRYPADLMVLATHRRRGLDRWLHKEVAQKIAREQPLASLFVPQHCRGFVSPAEGAVTLRTVLVPVDWIPSPQKAIDAAFSLARTLECEQPTFVLLHVADDEREMPSVDVPPREGWTWRRHTMAGEVVDSILAAASDVEADLIVMATQGHDGFLDALRGSTTERVLRHAECPVLAVPVSSGTP